MDKHKPTRNLKDRLRRRGRKPRERSLVIAEKTYDGEKHDRFCHELPAVFLKLWRSFEHRCTNYYFAKANEACRHKLHDRGPKEWLDAVNLIEDKFVRRHCASIIWWDYFGDRDSDDRWPHLDHFTTAPFVRVSERDAINGLITAGFTPDMAASRIRAHE